MSIIKHRRKVVGGVADYKETIVCLKSALSATTVAMSGITNPLGADLIITKVIVDITTACSATPVTFDAGCAAAAIGTSNDNLLDGVDIGTPTAAAIYDNITNKGSNGAPTRKWASAKYFTITASGTPTAVVGNVYIYYRKV